MRFFILLGLLVLVSGNFDVRTKWPGCSAEVLNQGGCGSCWAFGSSSAVSDRWCIKGKKVTLSPQTLVSCPECSGSCNGGTATHALKYMGSYGLQTCTSSCTSGCEPYTSGKKNSSCTNDVNNDRCHGCDKQCHDGKRAVRYMVQPDSIVNGQLDSRESAMMKEINTHGSITGGLSVYANWQGWVKKHGPDKVYDSHEGSEHRGAHAIKIIGYGTSMNVPYWLVQNSWGAGFGDNGTIKMLRGQNTSIPGGDRIIWDKSQYATPSSYGEEDFFTAFTDDAVRKSKLEKSTSEDDTFPVTGGWSEGDASHPSWLKWAHTVFALSGLDGELASLERIESQVVAGFNARFTIVSTSGHRAVISSFHGIDDELREPVQVQHLSPLN